MIRHPRSRILPNILVVAFAVAAVVLGQPAPEVGVTATDSGDIVAPALASAAPTTAPVAKSPRATPRGKEIYKGHTLDEIRADPSLLAEVLAEADYIRPINPSLGLDGEPDPPISDGSSDTVCPNQVECP